MKVVARLTPKLSMVKIKPLKKVIKVQTLTPRKKMMKLRKMAVATQSCWQS